MSRIIKTKEEVRELIKAETDKNAACKDSYFGGVYWHEPDESGCNWSMPTISGGDWNGCLEAMRNYVTKIRSEINIPDER